MSKKIRRKPNRLRHIETLEARQMMTGTPIDLHGAMPVELHNALDEVPALVQHEKSQPDFWLNPEDLAKLDGPGTVIDQLMAGANQQTGLNVAQAKYGFRGAGQTVAVIDSGIAWNHGALGGGLGSNYRVVGGWDFAENDSNPFDDGASGSHGTHVAGIVGANSGANSGVAPEVDFVGLRVFSDTGAGYFEWVESALQWVHNNRNSFENPITAVNLSLGTSWNAASIPSWAMLEEEFAQLKADGIFIAVSAGNSYTSYNTPGLSYPAASPNVVPVMSADDDGLLSYYSQRHSRAIAAPGRTIWSTVPDYAGNNNGQPDDWASKSGTSMAAPYVAGASVLIRQAMQFVGMTNITQDTIYNHMMATADTVTDSAGGSYKRLNMNSALSALMPVDDYGSTTGTAFNWGALNSGTTTRAGLLGTTTDVDYFTFTAGATGQMTFTAANLTHGVGVNWLGTGLTGTGASRTLSVTAGQSYTLGLQTTGGLGYYSLQANLQGSVNTPTFVDWGTVDSQSLRTGLSNTGEKWYRVTAQREGFFTTQASGGSGAVQIDLYNSNMTMVGAGGTARRAEVYAAAGQQFYLKCTGNDADYALSMTNALAVSGANVSLVGTAGVDTIVFLGGATPSVSINGALYSFTSVKNFLLDGSGGADVVTITGSSASEWVNFRQNNVQFMNATNWVLVQNVEDVTVNGGGGADAAYFYDTTGNDVFTSNVVRATMTGAGYRHAANNFAGITAYATAGGTDRANVNDWLGDDVLTLSPTIAHLRANNSWYYTRTEGFETTYVYATSGNDQASFSDTSGNDTFVANHFEAMMWGGGGYGYARNFDATTVTATTGTDRAYLFDSPLNDRFTATPTTAEIRTEEGRFRTTVNNFDSVAAQAVAGGVDTAYLYDSAGNDLFHATPTVAWMVGASNSTYYNGVTNFENVQGISTAGGIDYASLYDSAADDLFVGGRTSSRLSAVSGAYSLTATSFKGVYAYASTGEDTAELSDTTGQDWLTAAGNYAFLGATNYFNRTQGFKRVKATGNGGPDVVSVSALDYVFERLGSYV